MPRSFALAIFCWLIAGLPACQDNLDAGLVAFYPFNGNAEDHGGNQHHGEVHGAVLTSDRFGNANSAYRFDGSSATILARVTNMPAVDAAQTISWWFFIEQPPAYGDSLGADNMIALVDTAEGIGLQFGYRAPGYRTAGLDAWYWGGGTVLQSPPPALSEWHHCVYTYDGRTHRFYLNAQQVAQSAVQPQSGTPDMLMFGNYPSGDQFFDGRMDDLRIYHRTLLQSEVDLLYKREE